MGTLDPANKVCCRSNAYGSTDIAGDSQLPGTERAYVSGWKILTALRVHHMLDVRYVLSR